MSKSKQQQLKKLKTMYDKLVKDIEHLSGKSPDDFDLVTAFQLRTRLIEMFPPGLEPDAPYL